MDKRTQKIQKKYDRFSKFYDSLEGRMEKKYFRKWRRKLISKVKGKVLEIGVGTGKNLQYYDKNAKITGVDLSKEMLKKAKETAKKLGRDFKLIQMDAQKLEFERNTFDYVICTLVLCSVPDPVKALKEMKRVCKNNGKIILIEHVESNKLGIKTIQKLYNPLSKTILGCDVRRKTKENIIKAGLKIEKETNLALKDVFRKFEVIK